VIDVVFKYGKHWVLFDVSGQRSADDADIDMRIVTHDRIYED